MDQELSGPREQVASALVEAERRAAGAEAQLTTLQAEADGLRLLVGRLEVERDDLCRQLEISEPGPAAEDPEAKADGEPGEASTAEAMTYVRSRFMRTKAEGEPAEAPAAEEPGTEAEPGEVTGEEPGTEAQEEPGEVTGEAPAAEEPGTEAEPGEVTGEEPGTEAQEEPGEPAEAPAAEARTEAQEEPGEPAEAPAAEEPGTEPQPGEVTGEEPAEAPAAEEPEAPAGAAESGVRQLAESVTATIAIALPQVGSVRLQWDFRAENSEVNARMPTKMATREEAAAPQKIAAPKGKSTVAKTAKKTAKAKKK
jgi:hypothetical protein